MAKFFYVPFALSGTKTAVPDASQPSGTVNYTDGYGPDYANPLPGANAYPVDRGSFNQILNDVTLALNVIQSQGLNSWIGASPNTPADYPGNFAYPINALVYYTDGNIYQSLIASNQDVPGTSNNWLNISASNFGVPIGAIVDFLTPAVPANFLLLNSTAYSRTMYSALFNAMTITQANSTTTSGLNTITVSSTTNIQVGWYISGPGVTIGTTVSVVTSSTSITMSANATASSGVASLVFSPAPLGDGSSTFNVPNAPGVTTVNAGGITTTQFARNTTGYIGGEAAHTQLEAELAAHSHPGSTVAAGIGFGNSGFTEGLATGTHPVSVASDGSSQAFNIMQPSLVVYKAIRAF